MVDPGQTLSEKGSDPLFAPLSVVLAARNAAADVDRVVEDWTALLESLQRDYELILVDDASEDETSVRVEALSKRLPHLRFLRNPSRAGLGAVLRTGIAAAQHPLLFYTVCDRRYHPEDIRGMLKESDKLDVVVGYRVGRAPAWLTCVDAVKRVLARLFLGMSPEPRDVWLGWTGYGRRWAARWLFGLRLRDPECVFCLFRREHFKRIPIQIDGDFAAVEILAKANFLGCLMAEVPVTCLAEKGRNSTIGWDPPHRVHKQIRSLLRYPDFGPINPEAVRTSTVLRSSAEPAIFGQPLRFTATVAVDGEGHGTPAGPVIFRDGDKALGTAHLHDRTATLAAPSLTVGSHTIRAVYAGNRDFQGSTSAMVQKVEAVPTMALLVASAASVREGEAITLTATIKGEYSERAVPRGKVVFQSEADVLGAVPLERDTAVTTVSNLPRGQHSITAAYQGDKHFAPSTSTAVCVSVLPREE